MTGDDNFDHLIKVMSAKFLHCRVTIIPFWVSNLLGSNILRLGKSCLSDFHSLVLSCMDRFAYSSYYCGVSLVVFSISLFFFYIYYLDFY